MTETDIAIAKKQIDSMSQYQMAYAWRFHPAGHPYFNITNGDLADYFQKKFQEKGGMTPEISKSLGWGERT